MHYTSYLINLLNLWVHKWKMAVHWTLARIVVRQCYAEYLWFSTSPQLEGELFLFFVFVVDFLLTHTLHNTLFISE